MPEIDWRESHHWLRGYSDARACKDAQPQDAKYAEAYERGYKIGRELCQA